MARASALVLACGTLVESGGDPVIALVPTLQQLPDVLAAASVFYAACVDLSQNVQRDGDQEHAEQNGQRPSPIEEFGYSLSERMPAEAMCWLAVEPMCMGAISMLSRSVQGRRAARRQPLLLDRAQGLAGAHGQAGFLARMLRVLDDEPLLVLHPGTRRGYRVRCGGIADNFQLHTLLAGAHRCSGSGLAAWRAAGPARSGSGRDQPVGADARIAHGSFNLWAWRGWRPDGTFPEVPQGTEFWIWNEGMPADIPLFDGVRVVLLGPQPYPRSWNAGRCFEGLHAYLNVEETLGAEVQRWLDRIAAAPR